MKRYNKITAKLLTLIGWAVLAGACTDSVMDKINEDKNHPSNVQAKFILTDVITSTSFGGVGGDFSSYASVYMEHETGVYNQFYNAEIRSGEPTLATTYNNPWNSLYSNIKNAKLAIHKLENDVSEKGNDVTLGIAKVMLAYNAALLADLFGDAPYLQAGELNADGTPKYMQPAIDTQQTIYGQVLENINQAIGLFDGNDAGATGGIGANDFIYSGDADSWKKAAYGLKARYMLHLLNRSENPQEDLETILACVNNSFASPREEMKFAIYNGSSELNPLYALTSSRDAMGASASLVEKFKELDDPRLTYSFMQCTNPNRYTFEQLTNPDNIVAAPNGEPQQVQFRYSYSMISLAPTAPTQLLSYHEIKFIEAETLVRLGRIGADASLKEGITAAFANLQNSIRSAIEGNSFTGTPPTVNLNDTVASGYFTESVLPRFQSNPLKEVMLQKYLAFFGASGESIEAYNDYRRLKGEGSDAAVVLKNPNNTNRFPLRYTYGASDVSANLAVKAAFGDGQYVYTSPVWWAQP